MRLSDKLLALAALGGGALGAYVTPAHAQALQTASYSADITVTGTWQDITATYPAMAGTIGWVANKSSVPVVVVFTASAAAPGGGGVVLGAGQAPVFGNAAHVWVKSLGGTSVVAAGTGSASATTVTASAASPSYAAGPQPLSSDLSGQLRVRLENGADVTMGTTADSAWSTGQGTVISLLKTIAASALDTSGVNTVAIDTSNPGVSNVTAPSAKVVSGEQSFATGSWQPLTMTAGGRLKVGLSSATNITPGALSANTTASDLVGCQYTAAGVSFADGNTGVLQCDAAGRVMVSALSPTSATDASTNVAGATTSTLLLAANPARLGGAIVNDSASVLYLRLAAGASATSYDYYLAGAVNGVPAQFEIPTGWTGPIYGVWASATGTARVSERTK